MNPYNLSSYIIEWLQYTFRFLRLYLQSTHAIRMENIALRSQLALYVQRYEKEKLPKPTPTPAALGASFKAHEQLERGSANRQAGDRHPLASDSIQGVLESTLKENRTANNITGNHSTH